MTTAEVTVVASSAAGIDVDIIDGTGTARARIWPGMGAQHRSFHRIELQRGARTLPLSHPGEAVYYVAAGHPRVTEDGEAVHSLEEGSMVHIAPTGVYRFDADDEAAVILGGPCPPDPSWYESPEPAIENNEPDGKVRIFHRDRPGLKVPLISRDARFVVWAGEGAATANMNYVVLEPNESNVPHRHAASEDTIWVMHGSGTVEDLTNDRRMPVSAGDIIHVPVGVEHAVHADTGDRMVSVGGPCPADRHLLEMIGIELS